MQDHIINDQIADLARAMLELDNMDEAYRFFEDIFTIHELQAVAQRLAVARLLQKKVTYQEIAERTGASTATISRVNRCLKYGEDGYKTVLSRLAEQRKQSEPAKASKKTGTGEGKDE